MFSKISVPITPVERLKAEIARLDREQLEALRSAHCVRLSLQEAHLVSDRRRRIWELRQQLSLLGVPQ